MTWSDLVFMLLGAICTLFGVLHERRRWRKAVLKEANIALLKGELVAVEALTRVMESVIDD